MLDLKLYYLPGGKNIEKPRKTFFRPFRIFRFLRKTCKNL